MASNMRGSSRWLSSIRRGSRRARAAP
jgi:hypothetical protein